MQYNVVIFIFFPTKIKKKDSGQIQSVKTQKNFVSIRLYTPGTFSCFLKVNWENLVLVKLNSLAYSLLISFKTNDQSYCSMTNTTYMSVNLNKVTLNNLTKKNNYSHLTQETKAWYIYKRQKIKMGDRKKEMQSTIIVIT